ncbi:MAG: hypothetical protein L0323_11585 [Planctomycetes bacterium]|nr:hypothetical protein [Planctomycetota bacterium]
MRMKLWSAIAVSCLGASLAALPVLAQGEGGPTPAEAATQLKNATKAELLMLKIALLTSGADLRDDLFSHIFAILGGGATPEDGLENATSDLVDSRNETWGSAETVQRNLEIFGFTLLQGLGPGVFPLGFLLGDCQTIDKFVAAIEKELAKGRAKTLKDLKRFAKFLASLDYAMNPGLPPLAPTAPPAPNPTPPPAPGPNPLKIHGLAGGSSTLATLDGKLCVGGIADSAGGDVSVTITGPGGATQQQTVPVDIDRKWYVCFPPVGVPGNLPEGNYTVEATQGGSSASAAIGVPG